jgi:hypothetical protein
MFLKLTRFAKQLHDTTILVSNGYLIVNTHFITMMYLAPNISRIPFRDDVYVISIQGDENNYFVKIDENDMQNILKEK